MTDEWWKSLWNEAGRRLMDEREARLLNEFKALSEPTNEQKRNDSELANSTTRDLGSSNS